ncbi:farnesol dehydrogenase-like [Anthonomus grandis grandis]|uniref:farnesol dehydrogenase-like n=1 Tax=Anthonomus grandis grandis TaxID=2921223 RepID=UPI002165F0E5|nr:farnesol dehydrogenase-like [Anthonomus grandis grandis]
MVISMDRWVGQVAMVTGASAGIGAAIVKRLVENGLIVAGLARRKERIEEMSQTLKAQGVKGRLYGIQCDVSKESDILKAFKWVTEKLGPVHILVNNAGIIQDTTLCNGDTELWRKIFDVNVMGLCIATREAVKIMKGNKINGHIVHINSVVGHSVPAGLKGLNVYPGSKHAVTALAETLRMELVEENNLIKITSISPGVTATEILEAGEMGNTDLKSVFSTSTTILSAEDIADGVIYALSTPPHVQIKELTIKPISEKF